MPGLTFSNELLSRDEALHTEFAITLYGKIINKLEFKEMREIISNCEDYQTEGCECK